ncbi:DUF1361 domain-containing protein [Chitinophaga silvisoli]|uniref:DUF1361 domain-containing protein n=1 Tax=Chitinophaga silvisoli TaxID=2291814 RepID=A0A3E1P8M7_9BACT|nr:DUF1361 domain-containing protein [Chitinophaga silvisoli]RFM36533.1 DUF1361 domain-containing protein [Chitinophaga silvisoli]
MKSLTIMLKRISPLEKMLTLAIAFTMTLLLVRVLRYHDYFYLFYIWNTFLGVLPLFFSRKLDKLSGINLRTIMILACWLMFFPNAPYMITDLFHFSERPPVPLWYDLLIVSSAAWNGLLLGIISLMQVEHFLVRHLKGPWVKVIVLVSFVLCGYGVYIGRYLRFNSWDAVTNPEALLFTMAGHVLKPYNHLGAWAFSIGFGGMFGIIYYTLQQLHHHKKSAPQNEGRFFIS